MRVRELAPGQQDGWNRFVERTPGASFFHRAEWREVLERAFGFETIFLYAEEAGEITGILPLGVVDRPLFGRALISLPLCVYGGAVGDGREMLEAEALARGTALGAQYLELRDPAPSPGAAAQEGRFHTFRRTLEAEPEAILKAIPRKQRAEVRKGIAAGLRTVRDRNADLFYRIYAASVRDLGTPVFPKAYLHTLIEIFGARCEITTVFDGDAPLVSVLSFKDGDAVLPYYAGGTAGARGHGAYPFTYFQIMESAAREGLRQFDFGRSMAGTGAFAFKKNMGFEPSPLAYRHLLIKASAPPDMDPDSRRNRLLTSIWKRLPVPVANRLGPMVYPVIV